MPADMSPSSLSLEARRPASPPLPGTPVETINTMVHYYRGELGRMAGWRDRIDRTTNWAITVVAALLSVSLSTPTSHHGVLLFAMLLVTLLLLIEARRYRFFDVYRARVRQLERFYFAEILNPRGQLALDWAAPIAKSLRKPDFLISYRDAACRRLRRNYCWMYLILLLAWALKISSSTMQIQAGQGKDIALAFEHVVANAALGPVPGSVVLVCVALFYAAIAYGSLRVNMTDSELAHGEVHV
ncbi:DUF2270 domain-containing protein [Shinella sp. PSBB067]|uniref:DUF2270 domain-containing protein n=1 Tax=Shinella sp. PSBB067 TaxID=2715959 RepID=UPI00193C3E4A|nr:DUF2270 domain-containing protein [Shinella sp. PSBB067]QRI65262.1 DUF2270 domain-containing protein [Shinella sp. PSBB067]